MKSKTYRPFLKIFAIMLLQLVSSNSEKLFINVFPNLRKHVVHPSNPKSQVLQFLKHLTSSLFCYVVFGMVNKKMMHQKIARGQCILKFLG